MIRIGKILLLIVATMVVGGCQLLIDNRSRESGAVVVVPSDEWEAMRRASLNTSHVTEAAELDKTIDAEPELKIEEVPGSEKISFTNFTSASLGGCVTIGILEVKHAGKIDDAIILLKNEAFKFNSDLLIVSEMSSLQKERSTSILIEARMLTCPLKLARGNLSHG